MSVSPLIGRGIGFGGIHFLPTLGLGIGVAPPPPPPPPAPAETTGTGYLRWRTSTAKFAGAELECGAGIVRFDYRPSKPLPPAWPKPLEEQPLSHPATLTLHTARLEPCCAAVGMTALVDVQTIRYMEERRWQADLRAEEEAILLGGEPERMGEELLALSERMRAKRWWT